MEGFALAAGSVAGAPHRLAGRSSQDAFACLRTAQGLVAVVTDGCGGESASELGAGLGARLVAAALARGLAQALAGEELLAAARADALASLAAVLRGLDPEPPGPEGGLGPAARRHLVEAFLFTLVGMVATESEVLTFALGDGVAGMNGDLLVLGPWPDNQPPYLAYALLPEPTRPGLDLELRILHRRPAAEVRRVLLGSDGALDLPRLGLDPEALADDPRVFANPDMLRRRLTVLGRGQPGGGLPDDTTLVLVRRDGGP